MNLIKIKELRKENEKLCKSAYNLVSHGRIKRYIVDDILAFDMDEYNAYMKNETRGRPTKEKQAREKIAHLNEIIKKLEEEL